MKIVRIFLVFLTLTALSVSALPQNQTTTRNHTLTNAKGSYIPIRVSDDDRKLFERAAKASDDKTLSGWIRYTLKQAAQ